MAVIFKCRYCGKEIESDCHYEGPALEFSKFIADKAKALSDKCECRTKDGGMCVYCKPVHKTSSGELAHGEQMVVKDGIESCEYISVCVWTDGRLVIETGVDDLYATIKIDYCPKCGSKLREVEG